MTHILHGEARDGKKTAEYLVWAAMRRRCHDHKHKDYPYYGARGIIVCDQWRASYPAFLAEVGRRPSAKHSIDRIDNERNYEPGNVRWSTHSEQMKNRRPFKRKTHCPNGHEFTPENTYWVVSDGSRKCRECSRSNDRKRTVQKVIDNRARREARKIADGILRAHLTRMPA